MGMGRVGEPHVSNLPPLIFLSKIFLSHMAVASIQDSVFSRLQNGRNASFGSQPDQHTFNSQLRLLLLHLLLDEDFVFEIREGLEDVGVEKRLADGVEFHLQHVEVIVKSEGEKPIGQRSPCRRIKAIGPLGGFRSEQQGTVPEA